MLLFWPHFFEYMRSVWWLLVWHFESICMYFSIFVSRASIVYDTDYRVFHKDWDGSRTMVLDSMGWGKLFLWHKPVKVIADWCKIGCLDELYFIFSRCCMDIFCILVKSTLLFIPVSIHYWYTTRASWNTLDLTIFWSMDLLFLKSDSMICIVFYILMCINFVQ